MTHTVTLDRPAPADASLALRVDPMAGLDPANCALAVTKNATQATFSFTAAKASEVD